MREVQLRHYTQEHMHGQVRTQHTGHADRTRSLSVLYSGPKRGGGTSAAEQAPRRQISNTFTAKTKGAARNLISS